MAAAGTRIAEALLKFFVMRSGCFSLVDRGKGFAAVQQERALASNGDLQQGSNMGKGQIKAADYVLVPDIVSKNSDAGGTNVGGILGGPSVTARAQFWVASASTAARPMCCSR